MSQQINVFGTGWVSLDFRTGLLFPSDRMLVELLRPNIDPASVTLQCVGLIAAEQIPDLGSQLLLQAYSNDIISIIRDEQEVNGHLLDKLSIEQELNHWQSRYHQAVMMYVGAFFPAKTQNLGKLSRAAMQIENVNFQYRSMGNIAAIGDDLKNLVGFDSETNAVAEDAHKTYLRQRFLEYRISDDYLNALYLKAIESKGEAIANYIKQQQEQRASFERARVKRPPIQWAGVPTGEMCITAGVSADYLKNLRVRGLRTRGIYWYTLPGSERIIWIRDLVRDYLVNGNSPAHQRAIEKYLASLPSSSEYKPTAS
jgi:hypothetical protein